MATRILFLVLLASLFLVPQPAFADDGPKLPTARTVQLSGKMKVSEALAVLAKQTGIVIEDRRDQPDAELNFDASKATFWQVLDQIALVADSQVDLYSRDGKLALKKRPGEGPTKRMQFVSYDGLFRTSIKGITASLDMESGQKAYKAALEVAWEPTLQPFYLEVRPQNLVVKDDKGKVLPAVDLGKSEAPVDGRNALVFETPLPPLSREVKKIGHLKGNLSIVAPSSMLLFSFKPPLDQLKKGTRLTQAGVECEIGDIGPLKGDHWTVQIKLSYPPGNTKLDSNQSWIVNNELILESLNGKQHFPATSYVLDNASSTRSAKVTYNFQDDPKTKRLRGKPEDWKLTYRTPAAVVTIPISFSFKDVPLP